MFAFLSLTAICAPFKLFKYRIIASELLKLVTLIKTTHGQTLQKLS